MINKILFIGSKKFGLDTLKLINNLSPQSINRVITCNDSLDSRSCMNDFMEYAKEHDMDLLFSHSKSQTHEMIKDYNPDLCFVNGWYQLILDETLLIPKYGFIGIHHSLLPKYRGGSPLVWQLLNQENRLGSSIFYLEKGMDEGDIIAQTAIINENFYINQAREILEEKILSELSSVWPSIIDNTHCRIPQNYEEATYCAQLNADDGEINWNDSSKNIIASIRARSLPYPCAYFIYNGSRWRIVKAHPYKYIFYGKSGQVVGFEENTGYPIVSCGNGEAVVISELINAEDQVINARDILSSIKIRLCFP